ncbi:MAG: DMT family transporter [Bryobacteraceae bacterium]|nr:DMT family transporter [Bryobacteraceae bacterium]
MLSPLLLKEHLRRTDVWLLAGVGTGMALFFVSAEPATSTAPNPALGNALSLLSGLTWAFTLVGLRWLSRTDPSGTGTLATLVIGNLFAFFGALPLALPIHTIAASDVLVLLYLGVFQIGLAYYLLTRAIAHIPAFEAATLLLIEPALNPVWTWLILRERPATLALAGGVVILASTLLNTWSVTRDRPSGAV